MACTYVSERHGSAEVIRFKCKYCPRARDLANRDCRQGIFDVLADRPSVFQIVFEDVNTQRLDEQKTKDLVELAKAAKECIAHDFWQDEKLAPQDKQCASCLKERKKLAMTLKAYTQIHPIWAARLVDGVSNAFAGVVSAKCKSNPKRCVQVVSSNIKNVFTGLKRTRLVRQFLRTDPKGNPVFRDEEIANENIYRNLFTSLLRPFFITGFIAPEPQGLRKIDTIKIRSMDATLNFYEREDSPERLLTVDLPEFHLKPTEVALLNQVIQDMENTTPKTLEFTDPYRVSTFLTEILEELISRKNIKIPHQRKKLYVKILDRYITKPGVLTPLLHFDSGVQDLYIDTPAILSPVYVDHQTHETCATQIYMSRDDVEQLAMRLRTSTGARLDEGSPVLDGDLPAFNARVCALSAPAIYEPNEIHFALRIHRYEPWNLPLEINKKLLTPLMGGLLDFIIGAGAKLLIGGSKATTKTSVLESLIQESPIHRRKLLIEDTKEIHVEQLKRLGLKLQRIRVKNLMEELREQGSSKLSSREATAAGLRLGDADLIMGEIRERGAALTLFEAFAYEQTRSVMTTMHFHDARMSVDRLRKWDIDPADLKLVDFVISTGIFHFREKIQKHRRIFEIAEIGTEWSDDIIAEDGIQPIVSYDSKSDSWSNTIFKTSNSLRKILNQPRWPEDFHVSNVWNKIRYVPHQRINRLAAKHGLSDRDIIKSILTRAQIKNEICVAERENPRFVESGFYVPALNRFRAYLNRSGDYGAALDEWYKWFKSVRA